jgi:hypothetical protein
MSTIRKICSNARKRANLADRLPVRPEVVEVCYSRPPTASELRMGYGATHYRTFPLAQCVHKGTRVLKRWFVASDDGLRYYRS